MKQDVLKNKVERFCDNETRADVFVNAPNNEAFYVTNLESEKKVETLPHFMRRLEILRHDLFDEMHLESGVFNVRASFRLDEPVEAGEIITLPASYYPGRNTLYLSYGGAVCYPVNSRVHIGEEEFQYEEIGDNVNELSKEIRILFDAEPDRLFDMWVVTSALGKNLDAMEAILERTEAVRDEAEQAASTAQGAVKKSRAAEKQAQGSALLAQKAAQEVKEALAGIEPGDGIIIARKTVLLDCNVTAGSGFVVPSFFVGSNRLSVFYNGSRCCPGEDNQYIEEGVAGEESQSIQFNFDLAIGDTVLLEVVG